MIRHVELYKKWIRLRIGHKYRLLLVKGNYRWGQTFWWDSKTRYPVSQKVWLDWRPGPTDRWTQSVCKKGHRVDQIFGVGVIRFHPLQTSTKQSKICENNMEKKRQGYSVAGMLNPWISEASQMKADRRGWQLRRGYREQFQSRRTSERADAKLPIFISLTSLLYTTLVRFCYFCFRIFSTALSIFGEVDKKDGTKPETLVVRCVLFAYALCSSVSGTGSYAGETTVYGCLMGRMSRKHIIFSTDGKCFF